MKNLSQFGPAVWAVGEVDVLINSVLIKKKCIALTSHRSRGCRRHRDKLIRSDLNSVNAVFLVCIQHHEIWQFVWGADTEMIRMTICLSVWVCEWVSEWLRERETDRTIHYRFRAKVSCERRKTAYIVRRFAACLDCTSWCKGCAAVCAWYKIDPSYMKYLSKLFDIIKHIRPKGL